ncbi:hypothetical protein RZE82_08310 [Mollicutes bacterium LVI A0039]|nr:hypothetical protein RZE82_08310 [Mollicutes bacterium LVI A0039]
MKIFIDVDNTVLEHTSSYNARTESRVHKTMGQNPTFNEDAIKNMYYSAIVTDPNNFKKLFFRDNVYILTKSSNDTYEKYKQQKMASVLGITVEELINLKDAQGHPKYMFVGFTVDKSEYIKELFDKTDLNGCVLIDDYSENLTYWEEEGGIGIKFYNEYNSPIHPIGGLVISNFKLFSFKPEATQNSMMFVDSLVANEIRILDLDNINIIPIIDLIDDEVIKAFDLESKQFDTQKNKHSRFLSEYYQFMERFNFYKIDQFIKSHLKPGMVNIIENPFPYTKSLYKRDLDIKENLVIEYNASKKPRENAADVYVTMPSEIIYNYKHDMIKRTILEIVSIINNNQQ